MRIAHPVVTPSTPWPAPAERFLAALRSIEDCDRVDRRLMRQLEGDPRISDPRERPAGVWVAGTGIEFAVDAVHSTLAEILQSVCIRHSLCCRPGPCHVVHGAHRGADSSQLECRRGGRCRWSRRQGWCCRWLWRWDWPRWWQGRQGRRRQRRGWNGALFAALGARVHILQYGGYPVGHFVGEVGKFVRVPANGEVTKVVVRTTHARRTTPD